ncbi:hypothetical protein [Methylobacterium sp. JK268]
MKVSIFIFCLLISIQYARAGGQCFVNQITRISQCRLADANVGYLDEIQEISADFLGEETESKSGNWTIIKISGDDPSRLGISAVKLHRCVFFNVRPGTRLRLAIGRSRIDRSWTLACAGAWNRF